MGLVAFWCLGLKTPMQVLCYFSCDNVLQVPLAWPHLVREHQRLFHPGYCLKVSPTKGYFHWQELLSTSEGHLSKGNLVTFWPDRANPEMASLKSSSIFSVIPKRDARLPAEDLTLMEVWKTFGNPLFIFIPWDSIAVTAGWRHFYLCILTSFQFSENINSGRQRLGNEKNWFQWITLCCLKRIAPFFLDIFLDKHLPLGF